jgi:hypothetical protein
MKRRDATYTHCYCEENVYKFLETFVLKMEVAQRKRTAAAVEPQPTCSTSAGDATLSSCAGSSSPPSLIEVDPVQCSAACAFFVSTYHEDAAREKKNRWESQFPICTADVAGVVASAAATDHHASGDQASSSSAASPQYRGGDPFVLWDYHVIAMIWSRVHCAWYVVDLDTKIGMSLSEPILPDTPLRAVRADLYIKISFYPNAAVHRRWTQHNVAHLTKMAERTWMRVISAVDFLTTFRSDRTHMLKKSAQAGKVLGDDAYNSPPPKYPCITEASFVVGALLRKPVTAPAGVEAHTDAPVRPAQPVWTAESNLASFINMKNTTTVPGVPMPRDVFLEWASGSQRKDLP